MQQIVVDFMRIVLNFVTLDDDEVTTPRVIVQNQVAAILNEHFIYLVSDARLLSRAVDIVRQS